MKSKNMVQGAVIAAIYATLTLMLMPISYGIMQIRISEALCILPMFTPAAIPGLFLGCFIANILGPNGIIDAIFGSFASLLAAFLTYKLKENIVLALLPPVLINGLIIGFMLYYVYAVPMPFWACALWIAAGEAIACYGLGLPLFAFLKKKHI